jgi:hypothetical protein
LYTNTINSFNNAFSNLQQPTSNTNYQQRSNDDSLNIKPNPFQLTKEEVKEVKKDIK